MVTGGCPAALTVGVTAGRIDPEQQGRETVERVAATRGVSPRRESSHISHVVVWFHPAIERCSSPAP